eukprot:TRINITY_DN709_c0_g1_i2.p1 TRINITY_DN709_c0_g1~~TRINITY_DN709_c0_g1_i2.p1  ORF type:complete len:336 (-),score=126.56 TRINITY_DN709_c0_g1_i2:1577-2584(-)
MVRPRRRCCSTFFLHGHCRHQQAGHGPVRLPLRHHPHLFHFVATYVLLLVAAAVGVFEKKPLPLKETAKLAAGSMGFVVLTNLSLQYNSVGFYQVMKVMTTPTVVIIEALAFAKVLEVPLRLALVPVCLGVIFTAATDFRLNAVGTAFAVAGVLVTSFYQIGAGTLQRSLDCSALQLQLYTAPMSALFIMPFVPLFDNWRPSSPTSIWEYEFGTTNLLVIGLTGVLAFLVNVSIFLVIGRSSAVSYNTLGHFKTCFILISDFVLFSRPLDVRSAAGILMTMVGVFWYTHLKLDKVRREKEAVDQPAAVQLEPVVSRSPSGLDEEEQLALTNGERD